MLFVSTLVSILLVLVSRNAAEPSTIGHGNNTNAACILPFYSIGDECLVISNDFRGTWTQMRDICLSLDGDLVSLSNANLLYDINNYIVARPNGMEGVSYWIGAADRDTEGNWLWTRDGSFVRKTSPIWGQLYGPQPNGGIDQNCGIISSLEFNYVHDEQCDTPMHGLICQAKQNGAMKSREKIPNIDCPSDYILLGSGCFQIHLELDYTWEAAVDLCSGYHRHLAKFEDANYITDLYKYLQESQETGVFWIDGTDAEHENVWLHTDSSQVKRGTPFWRVNDDGQTQGPDLDTNINCIAIHYVSLYHFYDHICTQKLGAICQYEM